ncbi:MAG TPA: hypothetical protein VNZ22_17000 [Bacillota bacterium]|nr:hypothetical protein [Bacillota bacterium]
MNRFFFRFTPAASIIHLMTRRKKELNREERRSHSQCFRGKPLLCYLQTRSQPAHQSRSTDILVRSNVRTSGRSSIGTRALLVRRQTVTCNLQPATQLPLCGAMIGYLVVLDSFFFMILSRHDSVCLPFIAVLLPCAAIVGFLALSNRFLPLAANFLGAFPFPWRPGLLLCPFPYWGLFRISDFGCGSAALW